MTDTEPTSTSTGTGPSGDADPVVQDPVPTDPREPQDPATCTHPGAYVYAVAGDRPLPDDGQGQVPAAIAWRPIPDNDGGRRPGELLSASLGACSACGSLVAQLDTRHPDDPGGGFASHWIGLYDTSRPATGGTGGTGEIPADARTSALPLRRYTVNADPTDLTDDRTERLARVRGRGRHGQDLTVPYPTGPDDRATERSLVAELGRYGLRVRSLVRHDDGGFTVTVLAR